MLAQRRETRGTGITAARYFSICRELIFLGFALYEEEERLFGPDRALGKRGYEQALL